MFAELAYEMQIGVWTLYFMVAAAFIVSSLFTYYVYIPFMIKHSDMFDKYFPTLLILCFVFFLLLFEKYAILTIGIIWAGFLKIVINSEKYPRLNRVVDTIFFKS